MRTVKNATSSLRKASRSALKLVSGPETDIKVGNACELRNMPEGTIVHNVELRPGKGGQMARAAGASAQILGIEDKYVTMRLTSGEVRKGTRNLPRYCWRSRQRRPRSGYTSVKPEEPAGKAFARQYAVL